MIRGWLLALLFVLWALAAWRVTVADETPHAPLTYQFKLQQSAPADAL